MDVEADRETVRKKKSGSSEEWRNRLHPLISRGQTTWNIVKLLFRYTLCSQSRKHLKNDRSSSLVAWMIIHERVHVWKKISSRQQQIRSSSFTVAFSTDRRSLGYSRRIISNSVGNIEVTESLLEGGARTFSRSLYRFRTYRQWQGDAEDKASKEKSNLKERKMK